MMIMKPTHLWCRNFSRHMIFQLNLSKKLSFSETTSTDLYWSVLYAFNFREATHFEEGDEDRTTVDLDLGIWSSPPICESRRRNPRSTSTISWNQRFHRLWWRPKLKSEGSKDAPSQAILPSTDAPEETTGTEGWAEEVDGSILAMGSTVLSLTLTSEDWDRRGFRCSIWFASLLRKNKSPIKEQRPNAIQIYNGS